MENSARKELASRSPRRHSSAFERSLRDGVDRPDADTILGVLLVNATRLLSLLKDQNGIPLHRITRSDVETALDVIGLPNAFIHAAGDLIEERFRSSDLTHRQLSAFVRFGRAPGNSLNLPLKPKPSWTRVKQGLTDSIVSAYEQGADVHRPSKTMLQPSGPRRQMQARTKSDLPAVHLSPPANAASGEAARLPELSPEQTLARRRATSLPSSKSVPALATMKVSPPAALHARHNSHAVRHPSFSFGKAERFSFLKHPRVDYAPSQAEEAWGRVRHVFGTGPKPLPDGARKLLKAFQERWRERKSKMTDLIARLDKDGDGELQRSELHVLLKDVQESAEVPSDAIDQLLDAFDLDGNGSISAHELKRALCSTHQHLRKNMRAGGMGKFHVTSRQRHLRSGIESLSGIGLRLRAATGELPEYEQLRERLRELMSRHHLAIMDVFSGKSDVILTQAVFVEAVAKTFGLAPADVGMETAKALQSAVSEIFAEWDLGSLGVSCTDVQRILYKGGRLTIPKRARADAIFQADLRKQPEQETNETKERKKNRDELLSEAKQAFHGIVLHTREEQLQKRAARVAPVQLESLMQCMGTDSAEVLNLFLKWDVDGDGTVSEDEFTAAVVRLGFKFSQEVTHELFTFFDKDGSNSITIDEIEATLKWGRDRKNMRPLLAGWRQLSLSLDGSVPLHEQLRRKLSEQGRHPSEMFAHWDDSGDGSLDKEELAALMYTLGGMTLSTSELNKLFASFDADSSGRISLKELNAKLRNEVPVEQLMKALAEPEATGRLFDLFHSKWDTDGDGTLDIDEFSKVLESLEVDLPDENALDSLFTLFDEDGSGSISLKELQNSLHWVRSCEKCQALRSEAYTFEGTLSIRTQIRRALAANAVKVMDLFREWDSNGDGLLSYEEFTRAMPLMGIHADKAEYEDLFSQIDNDGDGIVTFKEFNRVLKRETDRMSVVKDNFGKDVVDSGWRPGSPKVQILEADNLRDSVRMENQLRGLKDVTLLVGMGTKPESRFVPISPGRARDESETKGMPNNGSVWAELAADGSSRKLI